MSECSSLFPFRLRRLYRFFRSGTIYRNDPKPRLSAFEYAWKYARKGGDACCDDTRVGSMTCKHRPIPSDTAQAACVQCELEAANPGLYDMSRFVHFADCPAERNRVGFCLAMCGNETAPSHETVEYFKEWVGHA